MKAQDLKNSILQLAIQGKLVEQREEEGTAKELLKKIEAEKKKLVEEGKIKKTKALPEIKEDEIPFDIPGSWEWVRLGEISHNWGQKKPDKLFDYIDVGSIDNVNGVLCNSENLVKPENAPSRARKIVKEGTVLYSTVRPYLLNICIVDREFAHEPIASTAFAILHPFNEINNSFLYYILRSPMFISYVSFVMIGVAYPAINDTNLLKGLIPLPPLQEQKRIVAKIEELMPYVDQYDAAYTEVEELNKKFPEDMQKSILQYAIQGKLVEQREEDGTAEELYQQIQAEKKKLIKEGKIKKTRALPEITEDEIPFDIPENWKWVRLGDALDIARGGSPRPIKAFITNSEDGVNWIKIGDTEKGGKYINNTNEKIIKEGMKKSRFVRKGDFLLSNSMSFGRPYILNIDGCIHDGWLALSQIVEVYIKDYLYYLLSSNMVFNQFASIVSGAVVNNLNSDKVRLTIVPLPPLAEQKRIVEKIEELLPYTKQLVKKVG